jgi:dihydroorotase-like cyclic amidohydrolase
MKADNSIFEGMTVRGGPRYVLSRGRVLAEGSTYVGETGKGIRQKSAPFRPIQL